MSSFGEETVKCALCGTENKIRVLYSTNAFGSPDLDFRPPEMERSCLFYEVNLCSKCGYAGDLSVPVKHTRKIKNLCREPIGDGEDFKIFRRCAEIEVIERGLSEAVLVYYLKAAWLADDEVRKNSARSMRIHFLKNLSLLEKKGSPDLNYEIFLVAVDVARRARRWDAARHYMEKFSKSAFDDIHKKMIIFQNNLISAKNVGCHQISEAEGYFGTYETCTFQQSDSPGFRILIGDVEAAGLEYHKEAAVKFFRMHIKEGGLSAEYEPTNKDDKNAIAIKCDGDLLCYVPKAISATIAKFPKDLRARLYIRPIKKSFYGFDSVSFNFDILECTADDGERANPCGDAVKIKLLWEIMKPKCDSIRKRFKFSDGCGVNLEDLLNAVLTNDTGYFYDNIFNGKLGRRLRAKCMKITVANMDRESPSRGDVDFASMILQSLFDGDLKSFYLALKLQKNLSRDEDFSDRIMRMVIFKRDKDVLSHVLDNFKLNFTAEVICFSIGYYYPYEYAFKLIEKCADPNGFNSFGNTVLTSYINAQWYDLIRQLVAFDKLDLNVADKEGHYPLTLVTAKRFDNSLIEDMVVRGADINLVGGYWGSPLIAAARRKNIDLVKFFLEKGADVNISSPYDKKSMPSTALMWAANNGDLRMVELLLSRKGINKNLENPFGMTALGYARNKSSDSYPAEENPYAAIIEMLSER